MKIVPVPCRSDNYMYAHRSTSAWSEIVSPPSKELTHVSLSRYLITDETTNTTAVVDPYDPAKLEAAAAKEGLTLGSTLLTTHHHNDHSGGNQEFIRQHPGVLVYAGSKQAPGADHLLKHDDTFKIGSLEVRAVATPCHTQDHICYFVEDKANNQRAVFTGDTLFVSGCGRFFEGTAAEMHTALNARLASLPDDTVTYVGHEYTKSNVAFSKSIEPTNPEILKLADFCNKNSVTTGISTIADEKKWNVFMRVHTNAVRTATKTESSIEAMAKLRELKNNFKG